MNVRDFVGKKHNKKHILLKTRGFCSTRFNVNPEMMQPISKLHQLQVQLL